MAESSTSFLTFDSTKEKQRRERGGFKPVSRSISKLKFPFELIETFVLFTTPEKGGVERHSWFFIRRLFNNFSIRRQLFFPPSQIKVINVLTGEGRCHLKKKKEKKEKEKHKCPFANRNCFSAPLSSPLESEGWKKSRRPEWISLGDFLDISSPFLIEIHYLKTGYWYFQTWTPLREEEEWKGEEGRGG